MPRVGAVNQHALVTGAAGFIGSHLVDRLLAEGWRVTGFDNFDPYYDEATKRRNIAAHLQHPAYRFVQGDFRRPEALAALSGDYSVIVHLAAKAGVRNSLLDPLGYQMTNLVGTQNLLTFARERDIKPFVFASSSSVYGNAPRLPWSEDDRELTPINPYASTKLAGEQLGYVYAKTFGLRFVGLRFFTVYGPRQRPDLAIHKFARMMLAGQPIPVYGDGSSERDFTFCADIVAGVRAAMDYAMDATKPDYELFNLGHNRTIGMMDMIAGIETALGKKAQIHWQDWQPGEMRRTWANIEKPRRLLGYDPQTSFVDGLSEFAVWLEQALAAERERA
jgi:UDP-glucuronate 4-epimerase